MILRQFYFSTEYDKAKKLCGLADDEIEYIVGRFKNHSRRAGQLRGRAVELVSGEKQIRTCFGDRLLWTETIFDTEDLFL